MPLSASDLSWSESESLSWSDSPSGTESPSITPSESPHIPAVFSDIHFQTMTFKVDGREIEVYGAGKTLELLQENEELKKRIEELEGISPSDVEKVPRRLDI